MKTFLVVCLVAVAAAAAAPQAKYTTKYDNIDIDEILNNERLYKKYFDCLKGGKCTPDGKELREILPDALATGCSKCSEAQRKGSEKVIKFLVEKKPADFAVLEKTYDPSGTFRAKYQADAKKLGISETMSPFFFVLAVAALAAVSATPQAMYTTKYDNVDLDEILTNERLYKKYFECLKGGKCTPDGKELKDIIPDALQTECKKCNEKQKKGAEKVIKYLLDKKPADYDILEKMYDPEGTYKKKYQAEAKKHGINI
ncbi:hypothetical protein AAG570_012187 [Ranatra chinensis]|uniref:Chemosensory protein n=1 Tax=Ranatra chinensis TaxID=642074 RepID=A0ABD0YI30_9HEMI